VLDDISDVHFFHYPTRTSSLAMTHLSTDYGSSPSVASFVPQLGRLHNKTTCSFREEGEFSEIYVVAERGIQTLIGEFPEGKEEVYFRLKTNPTFTGVSQIFVTSCIRKKVGMFATGTKVDIFPDCESASNGGVYKSNKDFNFDNIDCEYNVYNNQIKVGGSRATLHGSQDMIIRVTRSASENGKRKAENSFNTFELHVQQITSPDYSNAKEEDIVIYDVSSSSSSSSNNNNNNNNNNNDGVLMESVDKKIAGLGTIVAIAAGSALFGAIFAALLTNFALKRQKRKTAEKGSTAKYVRMDDGLGE